MRRQWLRLKFNHEEHEEHEEHEAHEAHEGNEQGWFPSNVFHFAPFVVQIEPLRDFGEGRAAVKGVGDRGAGHFSGAGRVAAVFSRKRFIYGRLRPVCGPDFLQKERSGAVRGDSGTGENRFLGVLGHAVTGANRFESVVGHAVTSANRFEAVVGRAVTGANRFESVVVHAETGANRFEAVVGRAATGANRF